MAIAPIEPDLDLDLVEKQASVAIAFTKIDLDYSGATGTITTKNLLPTRLLVSRDVIILCLFRFRSCWTRSSSLTSVRKASAQM